MNIPAVQLPNSKKKLTFNDVLKEIELEETLFIQDKDAMLEPSLYDKKYITFREFSNYFKEFSFAKERHHKERKEAGYVAPTHKSMPIPMLEDSEETKAVLNEIPRLREEDKVDADQEYLDLIMDIYDSLPRVEGTDVVYKDEFFLTIRKDPQMRKISTTIAREPDGKSRIKKETFQEVFDRMERDETSKTLSWPTIIEYFTKRGRPLTENEMNNLLNEDKQHDIEQVEEQKKKEQEEKEFFDKLKDEQSYSPPDLGKNKFKFGSQNKYPTDSLNDRDLDHDRNVRFEDDQYPENRRFGDSFNDRDLDYGRSNKFHVSQEREDLSQIQLTTHDFIENQKKLKKRAHSSSKDFKITVPRPFKFEKRAEMRPKTIREYKLQKMIQEKQIEDEMNHRHFRASKPPPEVMIPQFKNIMEKEHIRREEVKTHAKEITKQKEKLFEFYKREQRKAALKEELKKEEKQPKTKFKARNPPPDVVTEKMLDPAAEKYAREQRIKERAQKLLGESKLPENMSKNEDKMKKKKDERMKALEKELFEFDRRPKRRDKPDFEKLQNDFQAKLDQKKQQAKPIEVKPFNITEHKRTIKEIEEVKEDPKKFMKMLAGAVAKTTNKPVPVATTKKFSQVIDQKKDEELKAKSEKEQEQMEKEKKKKQTMSMKTIVQAKIARDDKTQEKAQERKQKLEEKKLDNKINEQKTKEHLDGVIQRGKDRTLQVDGYESTSEVMKMFRSVRNTMSVLSIAGITPKPLYSD